MDRVAFGSAGNRMEKSYPYKELMVNSYLPSPLARIGRTIGSSALSLKGIRYLGKEEILGGSRVLALRRNKGFVRVVR